MALVPNTITMCILRNLCSDLDMRQVVLVVETLLDNALEVLRPPTISGKMLLAGNSNVFTQRYAGACRRPGSLSTTVWHEDFCFRKVLVSQKGPQLHVT